MYTVNKKIAVTPFPSTQTKIEVGANGLPTIKQKRELTPLTVVYDSWDDDLDYIAGDIVYVPGDLCKHQGINQVYELEAGKPFILMPADQVVAFKTAGESETVS
jgi:hypothetical protein